MEIAKIQVSGTKAHVVSRKPIPAGLIGGRITVEYMDAIWSGLTKTIVFSGTVTRDVVSSEASVEIPHEVVAKAGKKLKVGFYGTRTDETLAIPTFYADLGLITEAADPAGDPGTDPSPPIWAQLAERVDALEQGGTGGGSGGVGPQGPAGPPGEPGYTPVRGLDYWTEEDKAEIKSYVDEAILGGAW